jgi:hypothetical protein
MRLKNPNQPRPIAATLGIALIILLALYSSLELLRNTTASFNESVDDISLFEKRFEGVKKLLRQSETIGFLSDQPNLGADYLLSLYTLSPRLVERSDSPQIFIVNVNGDAGEPGPASGEGQYTVRRVANATVYDFGRGVLLVERDSK